MTPRTAFYRPPSVPAGDDRPETAQGKCGPFEARGLERPVTGPELQALTGVTDRAVHDWCKAGVFGPDQLDHPGTGFRRTFRPIDVLVAAACLRTSRAFQSAAGHRSGCGLPLLVEVADQVRAGATDVQIRLGEHVELTVGIADLIAELGES